MVLIMNIGAFVVLAGLIWLALVEFGKSGIPDTFDETEERSHDPR